MPSNSFIDGKFNNYVWIVTLLRLTQLQRNIFLMFDIHLIKYNKIILRTIMQYKIHRNDWRKAVVRNEVRKKRMADSESVDSHSLICGFVDSKSFFTVL